MQYSTLHNVDISIAFDKLPNTTMQSIQRCAISGNCIENNYNPFFSFLYITSSQNHNYHCYILLPTIVQGRYYTWEEFVVKEKPCVLMCQSTSGEGIIAQFADKVADGTRCRKDSLDMCIEGECKVTSNLSCHTDVASKFLE